MLVWYWGRLYYDQRLTWAISGLLVCGSFTVAAVFWHPELPQCIIDEPTTATLLQAADHVLAAGLHSGVLWHFLRLSLARYHCRLELYVLRCLSAIVASVALLELTVLLLPRPILVAVVALYTGLSLTAGCWWTSLWLSLQSGGLAAHLPETLRLSLSSVTPLAFLRDTAVTDVVCQCLATARQLLPLSLLPDSDLPAALATLPPQLQARLLQPGLQVLRRPHARPHAVPTPSPRPSPRPAASLLPALLFRPSFPYRCNSCSPHGRRAQIRSGSTP
mgnify:CR=1 FL=1